MVHYLSRPRRECRRTPDSNYEQDAQGSGQQLAARIDWAPAVVAAGAHLAVVAARDHRHVDAVAALEGTQEAGCPPSRRSPAPARQRCRRLCSPAIGLAAAGRARPASSAGLHRPARTGSATSARRSPPAGAGSRTARIATSRSGKGRGGCQHDGHLHRDPGFEGNADETLQPAAVTVSVQGPIGK